MYVPFGLLSTNEPNKSRTLAEMSDPFQNLQERPGVMPPSPNEPVDNNCNTHHANDGNRVV
jgi:hypothetical protein